MSSHQTRRREINGHIKQARRLSERIQSTEYGDILKRQIGTYRQCLIRRKAFLIWFVQRNLPQQLIGR